MMTTSMPQQHQQQQSQSQPPKRRKLTVFLFSITTVLLFADQNLMAPNLTAIADEFNMTNDERDRQLGGDISLAFFLLGAPASLVVGCLADSCDRSMLFAVTTGIGETACLFTYFVTNYTQLYVCRAITGFSIGGALPLIYSILGDLFVAKDRHTVSAVVSFGIGAGISIGQAIAGYLGPTFGWRIPFVVVAIPALVCAWSVYMFVPDPERGAAEQYNHQVRSESYDQLMDQNVREDDEELHDDGDDPDGGLALVPVSSFSNMNDIATKKRDSLTNNGESVALTKAIPTNDERYDDDQEVSQSSSSDHDHRHQHYNNKLRSAITATTTSLRAHLQNTRELLSTPTLVLALIQGAPGCIPWGIINAFLNDYLAQDRGFTVEMATTTLMCFSLGHVCGLILGGIGGSKLYEIDTRFPSLLAGTFAIFGCFPFWWLLNGVSAAETEFWKTASIAWIAGFGSGPTGPIIKATITNVTPPLKRGQAFALENLFDDFGKGLGPYFVSVLIVNMGGRLPAFNIGVLGWIICGIANLLCFFTIQKDEARVMYANINSRMTSASSPAAPTLAAQSHHFT